VAQEDAVTKCLLRALGMALAASAATASDGLLEINHTCATTTGCFPGDTQGYPVQITLAGSYRLTSNLTVPASTNGIEVANGVDLDLGGFEIAGPVSCMASCPPAGPGSGVIGAPSGGVGPPSGGNQCSVSNGKIRGFSLDGVQLGLQADVRRLRVTDISRAGLILGGGSIAAENLINRVGQSGIRFTVGTTNAPSLYERNTIASTGAQSVVEGRASGPNVCVDQLCGTTGRKFLYLTTTTHNGANALTACAAGFHMASLPEIFDQTSFEYDTTRGYTTADSGNGLPNAFAWVRTGFPQNSAPVDPTESVNCQAWTSTAGGPTQGTTVSLGWPLAALLNNGLAEQWDADASTSCSTAQRVLCVQD
jgi:hypothetical protein